MLKKYFCHNVNKTKYCKASNLTSLNLVHLKLIVVPFPSALAVLVLYSIFNVGPNYAIGALCLGKFI